MPSLNALGTALLACAGSAVATQFTLADTYDHTNFFEKFTFFDEADTNSGFVVYQNQAEAQAQGLAKITSNNEVYLGVDHTTVLKGSGFAGRNSLRLESTASYKHGLIVARFSHLPANKCGSWPSFWTLGDNWPGDGEIDLYEGWNNILDNQPAFHVGDSKTYGQCILESAGQSAPVATSNCDNTFQNPPNQYLNQGCTATDSTGPWASPSGGTYAIEWTSDYIKLYNWAQGAEPSNIASSNPDTATWGTPAVSLQNSNCNIDSHFASQRLILDIDFCGNPVGTPAYWQQSCSATTGQATCADYVSKFPGDFAETYFQIQDIRYFSQSTKAATSSAAVSTKVAASSSKAAVSSSKAVASSSAVVVPTSVISSQSVVAVSSAAASSAAAVTGTVVATSRWSNSSVTATGAGAAVSSAAQLTTSTVYTTHVHTVSQCPPEVTDCPFRPHVTTETIALYTTVCPVLAAESSSAALAAESSSALAAQTTAGPAPPAVSVFVPSGGPETITTDITVVHTITSCAADITNCPARVSTEVVHTTYPAGQQTGVPVVPSAPANTIIPAVPITPVGAPSNGAGSSPSVIPAVPIAPANTVIPAVPIAPVGAPSNGAGSAPSIIPAVPIAPASTVIPAVPIAPGSAPSIIPAVPVAPVGNPSNGGNGTWSTFVAAPSVTPAGGNSAATGRPPVPVSSGLGSAGCTGTDCLPIPNSSAVRTGMSTLALVGAMAAMLL